MATRTPSTRFNEAAGIPRGRRLYGTLGLGRTSGFNEAAGIPRGRPSRHAGSERRRHASMRPRVFPAEDMLHANLSINLTWLQ